MHPPLLTRTGVLLATANLIAWVITVSAAPPHYVPDSAFHSEVTPTPGSMRFSEMTCWDCGRFIILGRELGSYWDPLPVTLLVIANLPPLRLASSDTPPFGQLQVQPAPFVIAVALWWLFLGAFAKVIGQVFRKRFRSSPTTRA
jgi:hypothetical protein